MTNPEVRRNPVEELAEDFLARFRRGERPSLAEYTQRHPELAGEIRDLFPALVMMEEAGPAPAEPRQARAGSALPDGRRLDRLGDYYILREVGRGGMGIVYEAEQQALGRHVALKVLPYQAASDPTFLKRFRREARSAARLHHSNIVPVFDVGEFQGTHYYAMQFIQGQGLDEVLLELRRLRGFAAASETGPSPTGCLKRPAEANLTANLARGFLTGQYQAADGEETEEGEPPQHAEAGVPIHKPGAPATGSCGGVPSLALRACVARSLLGNHEAKDLPLGQEMPHPEPPKDVPPASTAKPSGVASANTSSVGANPTDFSTQSDYHYYRSVARVGLQVAEALAYAHGQKILHRDIKPANLLLDLQGTVWVTDFGLAKEEGDDLTRTGDVVGTLRYMAPERFSGGADARSDVYSLGLTLYELLTLRPAFEESDRGRLVSRLTRDEPPRPRKRDRHVPRDLETIVLKAIAKEPARRYQSAADLAEDLGRFLADRPVRARRTSALEHAWRWCRRNPAVASLSVTLAVMMLALVIGLTAAVLLRGERDQALADRERAEAAEQRAKKAELEVQFRSHLARAMAYRHSGQAGQRFEGLREVKKALRLARRLNLGPPAILEVRNEAIACLCLPDFEVVQEWDGWPTGSSGFAVDAAFRRYARGDTKGTVHIHRLRDHREIYRLSGAGEVAGYWGLEFSPDGRFLHQICEVGKGYQARLWRLDGPRPTAVLADDHVDLAFRPDGGQYAAGYPDGSVRLFDTRSGKELRRFATGTRDNAFMLRWNPKYPRLLLHTNRDLRLLDLDTGNVQALPRIGPGATWSRAAWHPDGRVLAVACSDRKIYLWDTAANRLVLPPLEGHKNDGVMVRFNHAGDRLVSTDWSSAWFLWDTRTGRQLLTLPAGQPHVHFRSDDRWVAADTRAPKIRIFRHRGGQEFRTLVHRNTSGRGDYFGWSLPALDAAGRLLAVSLRESKTGLVDLARGEEAAVLPGDVPLGFERDGSLWTNGIHGVLRWPCTPHATTGRCRFGPPERFEEEANWDQHSKGADGQVIAMPKYHQGAIIVHLDTYRRLRLGPQEDVRNCAVSPDGRWVATGSHGLSRGGGAKIWDARTGRLLQTLPAGGSCGVRFSPDGKWLLATGGGPRLWAVPSWREGPDLRGTAHNAFAAFSADGKWLALGDAPGVVRLVTPGTGEEIARLTAPEKSRLQPTCFTNNQAELVTIGGESGAIHIFDLRAIRTQLAELGLDWDPGSIPPARPPGPVAPLQVEVDPGDLGLPPGQKRAYWQRQVAVTSVALALNPLNIPAALRRGQAYTRLGNRAQAIDDYCQALTLLPPENRARLPMSMPGQLNELAWQWATNPARQGAEGPKVLFLAKRAVALAPAAWLYRNTLGVVSYRVGQYAAARRHLERSLRDSRGEAAAFDLYFLAMCHQRRGDAARARDCFARAEQWVREQKGNMPQNWANELKVFRAEAVGVLRLPAAPRTRDQKPRRRAGPAKRSR
jgi:serine/threonine protein kinase/WD40 repeat protein